MVEGGGWGNHPCSRTSISPVYLLPMLINSDTRTQKLIISYKPLLEKLSRRQKQELNIENTSKETQN